MKRHVAWTRLTSLALSACLFLHALARAFAQAWLGEAAAALEITAAILLIRQRTRSYGVIVGAAVMALVVMAALLTSEFSATPVPLFLLFALLFLGMRIDRERNGIMVRSGRYEDFR